MIYRYRLTKWNLQNKEYINLKNSKNKHTKKKINKNSSCILQSMTNIRKLLNLKLKVSMKKLALKDIITFKCKNDIEKKNQSVKNIKI